MEESSCDRTVSYSSRRFRFVECIPESIQSISFSKLSDCLALSRGDGNLEVWENYNGLYQRKLRIPGTSNLRIEATTWCCNRLFTGSLSGDIAEWDFVRLQPRHCENLNAGPVWCLKSYNDLLAAGCENGKVYIIQSSPSGMSDGTCFHLSRSCGHEKSRILSLAWSRNGKYIAVGTANGRIKKYQVSAGSCDLGILCEKGSDCIIWDLAYLDAAIVSADSMGRVRFWNEENGTLLQSFKEHTLDVLALAAAPSSGMLFSTGADQKIVLYQKVRETNEWVKNCHLKSHTHDVRAMDLSVSGVLATGGVDTTLNVVHLDNFSASGVKKYDAFQGSSEDIVMDSEARFIVQQSNSAVKVWKVSQETGFSPLHTLEMKSDDSSYILSVSIALNGSKMAASTVHKLFVYCLDEDFLNLQCLLELDMPAYKMKFSEDGSLLLLATVTNGVCLIDAQNSECKDVLSMEDISSLLPITVFSTSSDCSYFAATGFSNETWVCSSNTGSVIYKFSAATSHIPRHAFTHGNSLIIFLSGKILSYNISGGEMVQVGVVQTNRFLPKGVCVLDDNFGAVQYSQGLSVFRYSTPSESKVICNKRLNTSSSFLLAVSACSNKTIVMVEQSSHKLIKTLPPVLSKEHYGT